MEFLDLLFDIFFYPLDPANLILEENPLVLSCLAVLVGMSVFGVFRRCYAALFGLS